MKYLIIGGNNPDVDVNNLPYVDIPEGVNRIYLDPATHNWPKNDDCVWGPWMNHTARKGTQPPTQYRQCVHTECNEVEYREVQG